MNKNSRDHITLLLNREFEDIREECCRSLSELKQEFQLELKENSDIFKEYLRLVDLVIDYESQIRGGEVYVKSLQQKLDDLEKKISGLEREKKELLQYKDRLERISSSFFYKVYSFFINIFRRKH